MVYDAARGQVVWFAPCCHQTQCCDMWQPQLPSNDTWTWDHRAWHHESPARPLDAWCGGQSGYGAGHAQVILYYAPSRCFGSDRAVTGVRIWDGHDWTSVAPPEGSPAPPDGVMAYDTSRNLLLMLSASGQHSAYTTWAWDGHWWTEIRTAHSPAGLGPLAMSEDPARHEIVATNEDGKGNVTTWTLRNDCSSR
ncbi:MAG: hypothetical protein ACYDAY_06255 [Candidatus Dormibacteria bacterium]